VGRGDGTIVQTGKEKRGKDLPYSGLLREELAALLVLIEGKDLLY